MTIQSDTRSKTTDAGTKRKAPRAFWPSTVVLLLSITILGGCATADLRNRQLKELGVQPTQEQEGATLMQTMLEKHGQAAWKSHQTVEMILRDDWRGLLSSLAGRPWDNELLNFTYELGTFNGRVEVLDGDTKGEIYGLHSWQGYEIEPGEPLELEDGSRTNFIIPAIIYLAELPFRLADAPILLHMADTLYEGKSYNLVFATWDRIEPHGENDQYILWINKETGLVDIAQYTIRDQFNFVDAAILYEDYRMIDGVMVPYTMIINAAPDDDKPFHTITMQKVTFDAIRPDSLHIFDSVKEFGDAKKPEE